MKNNQIIFLIILVISFANLSVFANNHLPKYNGWLGIELSHVPLSLGRHLSKVLKENQGIMIRHIYPDSPATKADLKPFDIIARFNDQDIYAFKQLGQLVRATPPGTSVTLHIIRQSQLQEINVNIQALPSRNDKFQGPPQFNQQPNWFKNPHTPTPFKDNFQQFNYSWSSADSESVMVESLGENRYRAKIKYSNQQGKQTEFIYEGKLNEIAQQIKAQKELPENRKHALLQALDMNKAPDIPNHWKRLQLPPWFYDNYPPLMPWFNKQY